MENKESRICSICRQARRSQDFPKVTRAGRLLSQANICLMCRAASSRNTEENDEESGGGKQLQHSRDVKHMQDAMEVEATLQKELDNLNQETQKKNIFGTSIALEAEQKKQAAQRELIDLKEESDKKSQATEDEPNPELTENTKVRREKITRLFSVTRLLAGNLTSNNIKATTQKNFGMFSHINQPQVAPKAEQLDKTSTKKTLSTESSTLFSQQHHAKESMADKAERLTNAIKEGQKIFKR